MNIKCQVAVDVAALNDYFHHSDSFATRLGIEIVEIGDDFAVAQMPLTSMHRNGMQNAHGGAIYSLVDMAFAAASHASGTFFVTAQTSITYLEPGRIGPLRGTAQKIRCGKTLGTYEIRVHDSDATLVAIAIITGYNTKIPISQFEKQCKTSVQEVEK